MGWFRKLFGEGKVKVVLTMSNGDKYDAKIPYEGSLETLLHNTYRAEFEQYIRNYCLVEFNKTVTKIDIVGAY